MAQVAAFHVILTTYGFWLPNDPRGSSSKEVRVDNLKPFGPAIYNQSGRSVAHLDHDRALRFEAKQALKYKPVQLTGFQAQAAAEGMKERITKSGYSIWAFAILKDHVHFVVKRHHYKVEQVARAMKQAASTELLDRGLHPFADMRLESGFLPSVWAQDFWKVFLFNDDDIWRSIEYVERNPERSGCPRQNWKFVVPFNGL